ncbi:hypothetical protein IF1G_00871 [Cordyceps javanica]|uniref:Uncharacterized protein n=1 Tax=Cordyceps javanica TaxID=43265 RepID=A0A545VH23_9HYPO|nr:hypothetical protein IF1G_00871 [Cordyceps javanica]
MVRTHAQPSGVTTPRVMCRRLSMRGGRHMDGGCRRMAFSECGPFGGAQGFWSSTEKNNANGCSICYLNWPDTFSAMVVCAQRYRDGERLTAR